MEQGGFPISLGIIIGTAMLGVCFIIGITLMAILIA